MLHLGRTNHTYAYTLDGSDLQDISAMKDLRIAIDKKLKFDDQTATIVTKLWKLTGYSVLSVRFF